MDMLQNLLPDIQQGFDGLIDRISEMGGNLVGIAESAYEWGANIVGAFLDGMMSQLDQVSSVASQIGDELSYWFAPGSPPRVAPKLDVWGSQAGQQFWDGVKNADSAVPVLNPPPVPGAGSAGATGLPAPTAGTADNPVARTNEILTYIAQLIEQLVGMGQQRESRASSARGSRARGGGEGVTAPEGTAEYFRQLNEQRLSGSRSRTA